MHSEGAFIHKRLKSEKDKPSFFISSQCFTQTEPLTLPLVNLWSGIQVLHVQYVSLWRSIHLFTLVSCSATKVKPASGRKSPISLLYWTRGECRIPCAASLILAQWEPGVGRWGGLELRGTRGECCYDACQAQRQWWRLLPFTFERIEVSCDSLSGGMWGEQCQHWLRLLLPDYRLWLTKRWNLWTAEMPTW